MKLKRIEDLLLYCVRSLEDDPVYRQHPMQEFDITEVLELCKLARARKLQVMEEQRQKRQSKK